MRHEEASQRATSEERTGPSLAVPVTEQPRIRVRGLPTDEELAAVVGVLLARRAAAAPPAPPPASRWGRSARPGPLPGWRACPLPVPLHR